MSKTKNETRQQPGFQDYLCSAEGTLFSRRAVHNVAYLLVLLLTVSSFAQTTPGGASAPASSTPSPAQTAQKLRLALANSALNPDGGPLGDYVQCEFTVAELFELRLSPNAVTLTDADSESLKKAIIQTAFSQDYKDTLNEGATNAFITSVVAENFSGRTQSQALVVIMTDFTSATGSPAAITSIHQSTAQLPLSDQLRSVVANSASISALSETLNKLPAATAAPLKSPVDVANSKQNAQQTQILNTARQAITVFLKPPDVGCAMSMLDYNETKRAYGDLVAKEYIAVQVVVRNLNADQEFQVHDAEFAVDVDPSGRHSRFYSGRDKLIVRTFSVAQQSFDKRNLSVHGAQAVGSLLSAIIPVYGGSFASAVGVLTGGALPALDKLWRDSSTDQLNLLNDTGFSSYINSRTVVPKSGVAVFVIFVPSSTFDSGWWTQECANQTYLGSEDVQKRVLPSGLSSGSTGIDVDRALEPCLISPTETTAGHTSYKVNRGVASKDNPVAFDLFSGPTVLPFKKWSGSMFRTFRELSFTVVSGAHTTEESQLKPSVTAVNCPKDSAGNIIFDAKDTLSCPVSGSNLGNVTKLRLRNSTDQKDSLDGNLTVQGDPTSGTVAFPEEALRGLSGASYLVFMVDKADIETATPATLHLSTSPTAVSVAPSSIDLTKDLPAAVKINGSHLKDLTSVTLTSKDGKITDTFTVSATGSTVLSVNITKTSKIAVADATTPITFDLSLQPSEKGAKAIETKLTLEAKGKLITNAKVTPKAPTTAAKKPPKKPTS